MFKTMAYYYFSSKWISQSHLFVVFPLLLNINNWFCRGKRKERKVEGLWHLLLAASAHPGQSSLRGGHCHSAGCDIHTLHQKPCPNTCPCIILWPFRFYFSNCTGCSYNLTSFISHYVFLIDIMWYRTFHTCHYFVSVFYLFLSSLRCPLQKGRSLICLVHHCVSQHMV